MSSAIRKRRDVRRQPAFQEGLARQRKISEQDFVSLADRMDRVISLQTLYEKVPIVRTALKLKILRRIREQTPACPWGACNGQYSTAKADIRRMA